MVITSKIIKTIVIPIVNIVMRDNSPIKNIIIYAGMCINFIIIFLYNNSLELLLNIILEINTKMEQISAIIYKIINTIITNKPLLKKIVSIRNPVKIQINANSTK
jgi:hypothetical protein